MSFLSRPSLHAHVILHPYPFYTDYDRACSGHKIAPCKLAWSFRAAAYEAEIIIPSCLSRENYLVLLSGLKWTYLLMAGAQSSERTTILI
ncbi:uncharacterized protein ARMOST_16081 [Armillaria ostoyae]|uniref:Uncharacterized protein n=1 Tax=Armillaria ostoyae TaxID=47428 RepID=A0A284RV77_ARMOS|nr:uncharacterized protein ARMOST_16081 [Armillaria ostoyae]